MKTRRELAFEELLQRNLQLELVINDVNKNKYALLYRGDVEEYNKLQDKALYLDACKALFIDEDEEEVVKAWEYAYFTGGYLEQGLHVKHFALMIELLKPLFNMIEEAYHSKIERSFYD